MTPALSLSRLILRDFRSYAALEARFAAPVVVITGENGVGKTNLLEAISLLGPGRGLRGARMGDLGRRVGEAPPLPWATSGRFETPIGPFDIGTGTAPDGGPERRAWMLDGVAQKSSTALAERVAAVWLTPQMDRLFQEGASGRRRFLDRLVWALEPAHAREVAAHDHAMAGRNRVLAEGRGDAAWLAALEEQMARHAVAAVAARQALARRLNAVLAGGQATGAFPAARMALACQIAAALEAGPALAVEETLREGLAADRRRDAAAGGAARGAHRTDMTLIHLEKDQPADRCSTGEQKALLVAVVLAHAALIAEARGFAPLLLLDEVVAHLDQPRREALFAALAALPAQSFLTGTDAAVFSPLSGLAEGFRAGAGIIVPDADYPLPESR
ncbi:DNA replication/repair protein RecF [Roseomonas hellenica]|uniref:DNA replication and repair protein RecF n=1 Tax=Plastoroseomonas hellenica TaxID=2687306 RepID=A0ABS5F3J5_9PROT|nr:DNA replication/repair protein RecF [Plastoroseomonas hellenica]MBR0667096.1 DNA replication/repair protein RecF [Plastoroseomonas hellenica]